MGYVLESKVLRQKDRHHGNTSYCSCEHANNVTEERLKFAWRPTHWQRAI